MSALSTIRALSPQINARHAPPSEGPVRPERLPLTFGTLYPEGNVLAMIDDRRDAVRAVQTPLTAGIPAGDIDLVEGPQPPHP